MSFLICSCQREIGECEVSEINIYAMSVDILIFVASSEKDMRNGEIHKRVISQEKIKELTLIINRLNKFEEEYSGMDVRIVIDMKCKIFGKSTILANNNLVKIGNEFFEPSEEFFDFVGI